MKLVSRAILFSGLSLLAVCTQKESVTGIFCNTAADCPMERPLCDTTFHSCYNADMGAAHIRCTKETQSEKCAATAPICGDDKICRACAANNECSSQVCLGDGSCAAEVDVAYVDNKNGTCTGSGAGTKAESYCQIQTAIAANKHIIRVNSSQSDYGRLTINDGAVAIIGTDSGTVKISEVSANPSIVISGQNTVVSLQNIEIGGGGINQDGIFCSSPALGPQLTVFRSVIRGVSGAGISATKCIVTIDRTQIGPSNSGGGVKLTDSKYSITNSLIVGNGATGPGLSFFGSTAPVAGQGFRHNTVSGNTLGVNMPGAIACSAVTSTLIENSIIWNNSKMGATQFSGNCTFANTVIDESAAPSGTGNRNMPAPDFVSTSDFHLSGKTANNQACCIDQIDTSPIDHDFDGTKRPQGLKFDIGAHEIR